MVHNPYLLINLNLQSILLFLLPIGSAVNVINPSAINKEIFVRYNLMEER